MRNIYPPEAIREGLINAFVHRDYSGVSGGIKIEISQNNIKIWNSGGLPEGLDEEKLKKGHLSILRNPDIAHFIYLCGYMEKLGRGSMLIQELCKKYNLPEPIWKSDGKTGVTLTLMANENQESSLKDQESSLKNQESSLNIKLLKLDDKLKEVIELINDNPNIDRIEIGEKLELSISGVQKRINKLKEEGIIERVGGSKGYWEIKLENK